MGEVSIHTFRKARITGTAGTIGLAVILFLVLLLNYIITPIPPYPEGGGSNGMGIEVNLGYSNTGFGEIQQPDISMPDFVNEPVKQVASGRSIQEQSEKILTQDLEETAAIPGSETKDDKQVQKSTNNTNKETSDQKTQQNINEKKQPEFNQNASFKNFKGRNISETNQGVAGGSGDQGDPNGRQSSTTYGEGGGNGNGIGNGIGDGIGDGSGLSFSLENRSALTLPKPVYSTQASGKVVVQVTVDRTGKVINAVPGVKGSTTLDSYLLDVAKKAALSSRFNTSENAPLYQTGTIEYVFRLR